jgi:uncharacterized protein DUF1918
LGLVAALARSPAFMRRYATLMTMGSGTPPYLVRWVDSHESLFTPSSDTHVEHRPAVQRRGG